MFAPYVYIELPLGSSRRELRFWEMGYWLLTYSGAITKNFIGLQAIFALQVRFLCLLPLYIFSSLLGAQGGGAPFFGKGFWAPSKSRSSHKKFQSSMIDIGSAVCILVLVFVWYYWCQLLPVFGLGGSKWAVMCNSAWVLLDEVHAVRLIRLDFSPLETAEKIGVV